ncbi:DNA polymerase III subunit gamma and tau [Canibacter sp. lx-72]|uniref:DNA polymerase III subunit gamma and tau n=1 Tax=Canibacter zhuwentaonis TaxID=2837491 RepID=UPI001BDD3775|nr:DNA polymerase III subunit gamma and tau [Canibacter zhuwentaonis]MBT1018538.1 DNA polymerase III subunit gamma and tau [Canibacter zhuwentaonis]
MAIALYRRYRPETFAEMIGQTHVTEPLVTALRSNRIGHAYLFSGPRGCGKTTSARVLARCLNCAQGLTDTPCGECASCVELGRNGGGSMDVVEIDAASHGGVEDARDLRERANFAPVRDRYKIFIIDEAHMVTTHGFNALLKIVEEPPEYLKFIFATTEPEKVLGTIKSRTHHYPFRLIAPGMLADYVSALCESESVALEAGVLPLLVRAGGGSARDTLSILDQLIAGSAERRVTLQLATALLGFTSAELITEVIAALAAGDSGRVFAMVEQVVQAGQDPRRFTEDLLLRMRDLIVVAATDEHGVQSVFRDLPQGAVPEMRAQARLFAQGKLSQVALIVNDTLNSMGGATAPQLQLELMMAQALVAIGVKPVRGADATVQSDAPEQSGVPAQFGAVQNETAGEQKPQNQVSISEIKDFLRKQIHNVETSAPSTKFLADSPAPAASVQPGVQSAQSVLPVAQTAQRVPSAPQRVNSGETHGTTVPVSGQIPGGVPAGVQDGEQLSGGTSAGAQDSGQLPGKVSDAMQNTASVLQNQTIAGDEMQELWQELLGEIQENALALQASLLIVPLKLDGALFSVGVRSDSDLDRFKQHGAASVREVLQEVLGVQIRYKAQQITDAQFEHQQELHRQARQAAENVPVPQQSMGGSGSPAPQNAPTSPGSPVFQGASPPQNESCSAVTPESTSPAVSGGAHASQTLASVQPPQQPAPAAQTAPAQDAPLQNQLPEVERYGDSVVQNVFPAAKVISEGPFERPSENASAETDEQAYGGASEGYGFSMDQN